MTLGLNYACPAGLQFDFCRWKRGFTFPREKIEVNPPNFIEPDAVTVLNLTAA
jgi:hypothetical protein